MLRRGQQNLTNFFDHSPIGLEWLSVGGNILRANQAQLDLLGCSAGGVSGALLRGILPDPAGARELLKRLAANETVRNFRMLAAAQGRDDRAWCWWMPSRCWT